MKSGLLRQLQAVLLALLLLAVLVFVLSFDGSLLRAPEPVLRLQEVQLYQPPPPPPPQARSAASAAARPRLELATPAAAVQLETMPLLIELDGSGDALAGQGFGGLVEGLGTGLPTVGLSELDSQPAVLNAPTMPYPRHLAERGIKRFEVLFHIIVDEQGNTLPVRLLQNPYPELEDELLDFARRTRFSPPLRLGVAVRAEYQWPVVIDNDL